MRLRHRKWLIFLSLIVLLALWLIWGNVTIRTDTFEVQSDQIPEAFDGYRIVQVSDVHQAVLGRGNERLLSAVRDADPDMIALTGDLIDAHRFDPKDALALTERLVEIAPCYFVTGNHEAWIGDRYEEVEAALVDQGVTVLRNASAEITRGDAIIDVLGIEDPAFAPYIDDAGSSAVIAQTLRGMDRSDHFTVLLSHRPEAFEVYVTEDIPLVLSGHAHGGQVRLPLIGGLVAPDQGWFPRYDAGCYQEEDTRMIVSRGIGNSIIPVRVNNRPEIVTVILRSS